MQQLGALLTSIVPTFGVVAVGWLCRRIKIWDKKAVHALNAYAYYIALPALIFQSLITSDLGAHLGSDDLKLVGGVLGAHLIIFVVASVITRARRFTVPTRAVAPMLLTFGSTAYLGIPYVTNTFGVAAASYAAIISVVLVVALLFASIFILRTHGTVPTGGGSFTHQLFGLPFLWAVIAGLAVTFLNIPLPDFISKTINTLAGSAGPTALLAIGAFDYDIKIKNIRFGAAFFLGAGKVFGTGLLTFLILKLLGVTGVLLAVGAAMGSVSIAITAFVLADQYKVGREITNAAMVVSSSAAFVALTTIAYLWISTGVFG